MKVKITNIAWDVLPKGREIFFDLAEVHESLTWQYYMVIGQTQGKLAQETEEVT